MPANNRCSKCQCRLYCSRDCQKKDWKLHKRYCPPLLQTDAEFTQWNKHTLIHMNIPLTYDQIRARATDPKDRNSVKAVMEQVLLLGPAERENNWPLKPKDTWNLNQAWDELRQLPVDPFEGYVFSFATTGDMDRKTGELIYMISVACQRKQETRLVAHVTGRPGQWELEHALYVSMVKPSMGSPERPGFLLFAHRWGDVSALISSLENNMEFMNVRMETRQAALISARDNDTDPDGYNFER